MTPSCIAAALALAGATLALCEVPVRAQQPFVTDNAGVTPRATVHVEVVDEFDALQHSASPSLSQNTASLLAAYGVNEQVEVSVSAPLITISNSSAARLQRPTGIGDADLAVKYNFLEEREGSRRPAMAFSFTLELPTGSVPKGIGSGLVDYGFNVVAQKSLSRRTTLQVNAGTILSGNTVSGALGIRRRGTVLTASSLVARLFTPKLRLGAEIAGAMTPGTDFGQGQLLVQFGGNYQFRRNATFDFSVLAGRFAASPRLGVQVGFSIDFPPN